MSASVSSLIPAAVDQPDALAVAARDVPDDLLHVLAGVTDPRARRGVRHQLVVILGIAVCATLAGSTSFIEIAEWAHDLSRQVWDRLGISRNPPSETAIRRTLALVDPELFDRCVSSWIAAQCLTGYEDSASRYAAACGG